MSGNPPQFADRLLLQAVREYEGYGIDPGGGVIVPMFGDFDPMQPESKVAALSRSQRALDNAGVRRAFMHWALPKLNSYIQGTGDPTDPPTWTIFLEACGWERRGDLSDENRTIWRPATDPTPSLTSRLFRGGRRYIARGCRGSWVLSADAGKPVPISFALSGVYSNSDLAELPLDTLGFPGLPPTFCNSGFTISPKGHEDILPVVNQLQIASNTGLKSRIPSSETGEVKEFRILSRNVRWSTSIEVNPAHDYIRWHREGQGFNLRVSIGQDVGDKFTFKARENHSAQLIERPRFTRGPSGILMWNLVFGVRGQRDSSLEIAYE